jgi:hypothetical protein
MSVRGDHREKLKKITLSHRIDVFKIKFFYDKIEIAGESDLELHVKLIHILTLN